MCLVAIGRVRLHGPVYMEVCGGFVVYDFVGRETDSRVRGYEG